MGYDADKYVTGSGAKFFRGKEIKGSFTKVNIKDVREANLPNSGATLILDFDYKKEEKSLALNITNLKKIKAIFGSNTDKWIGKEIILKKVLVRNPKTNEEVESIRVEISVQKELPAEKKKK